MNAFYNIVVFYSTFILLLQEITEDR